MFKRFHDKSHNMSRGPPLQAQTYQQISKSKSALKTKYSQRHKQRLQATQQTFIPVMEVIRSDAFIYQGFVKDQMKHGQGVMMLRNGTIIVGTWHQDFLEGRAIIFTSLGCRVLVQFIQGRFNGWAIATYRQRLAKCLLFYEGHLDGEKLTFDGGQSLWVAAKCAYDGKLLSITHVEKGELSEPPSFLQSEDLHLLLTRFVVNKERFIEFSVIQQIQSNSNSGYIGFVDQERRPCGLGVICTQREIYAGNFFEGVLEHYGRMLFQNGEVYHGEMLGGVFWGRGIYYSPARNQTHILFTDAQEQVMQRELEGYYMIDIVPNIGGYSANNNTGIKGSTLKLIEESFEPYYRKEFGSSKKVDKLEQSNNSEYGRSEEMSGQFKEGRQLKDAKDKITASLSPAKIKESQKWLKFSEQENPNAALAYKRTYSLDKREAAVIRQNKAVDVIKHKPTEYQSIQIKENINRQEAEGFQKQNPPQTKLMQEIQFNPDGFKLKKESKSLELEQLTITMRNSTLQSMPEQQRQERNKQIEMMSKVSEISQSESSQYSGNQQQLLTILEKNKGYRKRIFY